MGTFIYVPLGGDLAHDEEGVVIVGPRTKRACDAAIRAAHTMQSHGHTVLVLYTPSVAGPAYGFQIMGRVMQDYHGRVAPDIPSSFRKAKEFSTAWEIIAAAEFATAYRLEHNLEPQVVLVAETWRAARTELIASRVFPVIAEAVPWNIRTFDSEGGWLKQNFYWPIYEFRARRKARKFLDEQFPARTPHTRRPF